MVESHTKKDIEQISYDILKASKSWGKFPTPVDSIVTYSELIVNQTIDVSEIHHGYLSKANDALRSALSKVRGIFDRSDKTIYLDLSQNNQKKNFVKLHEVGHGVLPWQNEILSFLDDDSTLSLDYRYQFEAEANVFASDTLFQLDRFEEEMAKLEFGLKSPMALAKKFGSSNHAAFRRFVEHSKSACALLVLTGDQHRKFSCEVRDYFQSKKFYEKFGEIKWDESLSSEWPFIRDYGFGARMKIRGTFKLITADGGVDCYYDIFNNTYNAFVLIYPKGEKAGGKTKIVISNSLSKF
jgi:hypothetical protein